MAKRILRTGRKPGRPAAASDGATNTREILLAAAQQLVNERGLQQLSLKEVAERAQVNPALLNYYFGGRDALQLALLDRELGPLQERLLGAAVSADKPVQRVRRVLELLAQASERFAALAGVLLTQSLTKVGGGKGEGGSASSFYQSALKLLAGLLSELSVSQPQEVAGFLLTGAIFAVHAPPPRLPVEDAVSMLMSAFEKKVVST